MSGHAERALSLYGLLSAVRVVRWDLVDSSAFTRSLSNYFRAPIFQCGNLVLWDAERWELDIIPHLRIPADRFGLPIGGAAFRVDRFVGTWSGTVTASMTSGDAPLTSAGCAIVSLEGSGSLLTMFWPLCSVHQ